MLKCFVYKSPGDLSVYVFPPELMCFTSSNSDLSHHLSCLASLHNVRRRKIVDNLDTFTSHTSGANHLYPGMETFYQHLETKVLANDGEDMVGNDPDRRVFM